MYVAAVSCQQFRKDREDVKRELCLKVGIDTFCFFLFASFSVVLSLRDAPKTSILSKPKWGAQAAVRGQGLFWPLRSHGTALQPHCSF